MRCRSRKNGVEEITRIYFQGDCGRSCKHASRMSGLRARAALQKNGVFPVRASDASSSWGGGGTSVRDHETASNLATAALTCGRVLRGGVPRAATGIPRSPWFLVQM